MNCMSQDVEAAAKAASSTGSITRSPIQIWDAKMPSAPVLLGSKKTELSEALAHVNFDNLVLTDLFFREIFQRPPVSTDNALMRSFLHHPQAFNNAFWSLNTKSVYYGNTDPRIFVSFVENSEITTHEFGHAVTDLSSKLEYKGQSGALNESVSDVFAIIHKHRLSNITSAQDPNASWLIGERIVAFPDGANQSLRSLKEPGTAYKHHKYLKDDPQPNHMDNYQNLPETKDGDWGGVHINSGIPNRAFYLAASYTGQATYGDVGRIWYTTLVQSNSKDGFSEFAKRTIKVAGEINNPLVQSVGKAWGEVGVDIR